MLFRHVLRCMLVVHVHISCHLANLCIFPSFGCIILHYISFSFTSSPLFSYILAGLHCIVVPFFLFFLRLYTKTFFFSSRRPSPHSFRFFFNLLYTHTHIFTIVFFFLFFFFFLHTSYSSQLSNYRFKKITKFMYIMVYVLLYICILPGLYIYF